MWLVPWLKMPSKPENSLRVRTRLIPDLSSSDDTRQEVLTAGCSGCSRTWSCRSWYLFPPVCSGQNTGRVRRRRLEEEDLA